MITPFDQVFASVPKELRRRLQKHFEKVRHDHALGRYETSELNGGKFCEAVAPILEWYANANGLAIPGKPTTHLDTRLRRLANCHNFLESFRLNIPDVLLSVYRIRNKRGVAHINGDVDPNYMDSSYVVAAANWVMSELVRVLYSVTLEEATRLVDRITTKRIPLVWEIGNRRRVLNPSLSEKHAVLALLYFEHPNPIVQHELIEWVESNNPSRLKTQYLPAMHKSRLIDVEKTTNLVRLSPRGLAFVEAEIPLEFPYP